MPYRIKDRGASIVRHDHARGFTLIEIMTTMVITAIFVYGLMALWVNVNDHFFRMTLRQQAILQLNGHMERLSALYRYTNFTMNAATHADGGVAIDRWIYRADPAGITGLLINDDSAAFNTSPYHMVLHNDNGATGNDVSDENIIWLDPEREITAKLSWELSSITSQTSGIIENCWSSSAPSSSDFCYELALSLEYPFRFDAAGAAANNNMGYTEILELRTYVGQRLP